MSSNKGHFFYSESQRQILNKRKSMKNFCKLLNGDVVEYTEWCQTKRPAGSFNDYIYLGFGIYDHNEKNYDYCGY